MSAETSRVTVDDTRDLLVAGSRFTEDVSILNKGASVIYIGDETVTDATGFEVPVGEKFRCTLDQTEELWAVTAAAGSATVHVIRIT